MKIILSFIVTTFCGLQLDAAQLLFQDDFHGQLGGGWSWIREHPQAWRIKSDALEVRIEPGNMWGPANSARNLLVRPAPAPGTNEIEVAVTVENHPTGQYEQVDLVWYYDDSNMVKLGEELVDGKLSIVMGREERDKTRTVAIIPLTSPSVRLKLLVRDNQVRGLFRLPKATAWQEAGQCTLPAPANSAARICLQFYQGPEQLEHWARVTEFRILKH